MDKWIYRSLVIIQASDLVIIQASDLYKTILILNLRVNKKQFEVCFVKIEAILQFDPLCKFQMTFDLHKAIILYNSKTKLILTHVELSRSMVGIWEMPQYVTYLKMKSFY